MEAQTQHFRTKNNDSYFQYSFIVPTGSSMSCARTRGVTPRTAWQNCIPNGQRTNGACLPCCPPRVWVHPTDGASNFVHASHGVLHGYGRCYIPPDLKMRKIQPTRVLVRDGFGHNWTAVSSNPDETGVKRMLSTRSSVLRGPKLFKNTHILRKI